MSQAFFADPLGSWPSDLSDVLRECSRHSASPNSYIDVYNEELIIKSILKRNSCDVDKERLGREVDMTLLAGNDCAIPVIGRFFNHGLIVGFITRFGKCITPGLEGEDIRPEYHEDRLSVIQKFCALLDRLHSKGIIHGDVKPSNLVFDAAGDLRFIDFAEAVLESEPPCRHASTTHYTSPSYMKSGSHLTPCRRPVCSRRGRFGTFTLGVYHSKTIEEDDLDLLIEEGLRPDLSLIDDEDVRALICRYLDGEHPAL